MSEGSYPRPYPTSDPSNAYFRSPPDSPTVDLNKLFGPTSAQLYPDHQYQASDFPQGYGHAPSSSTASSWESGFAQDNDIEQPGQQYDPPYQNDDGPHAQYTDQPVQPCYPPPHGPLAPEAYQYVPDHAGNVASAQWPGAYGDADEDVDDEAVQFPRQRRQKRNTKARVAASLPEGQLKSKRAERRAQIFHEFGSVSATDQPRGKTRMRFGILEWFNPETFKFRAAAPLDDYRQQIISEDNARGDYDHKPDRGLHEDDVTSFPLNDFLGQPHWNLKDRSAWVHIKDQDANQVMYLVERPDRDIEPPNPGFMMYNGMIMLDPDDHPIIDFPGLPRCFSSQMEGARIEALRRIYPWLSLPHFRARMPRWITRKTVGVHPLYGLSSLQQRLTRFRELYDCPPWKKVNVSRGSHLFKHTKDRLAKNGLSGDSTAGLSPLTRKEVKQRKQCFLGKCPENAGIYTLTEEEKQEKAAKEAARHEEARAKRQKVHQEVAVLGYLPGTKRKWDDATEPGSSLQPVQKQVRSASSATVDTSQRASPMPAYSMAQSEPAGSLSNADTNSEKYLVRSEKSTHNPHDLRWRAPQTISEQLSIKSALSYTVADYKNYNSTEPPPTTSTYSYFEQYQQIQNHHRVNWSLEDEPAPQLVYIPDWFGSFQSVPLYQADTYANADASSRQHQADTYAGAEASSDQVSDWLSDLDFSCFLEEGAWNCDIQPSVLTSADETQSEAAKVETAAEDWAMMM